MLEDLIKLANHLDIIGYIKEADHIDDMTKKILMSKYASIENGPEDLSPLLTPLVSLGWTVEPPDPDLANIYKTEDDGSITTLPNPANNGTAYLNHPSPESKMSDIFISSYVYDENSFWYLGSYIDFGKDQEGMPMVDFKGTPAENLDYISAVTKAFLSLDSGLLSRPEPEYRVQAVDLAVNSIMDDINFQDFKLLEETLLILIGDKGFQFHKRESEAESIYNRFY